MRSPSVPPPNIMLWSRSITFDSPHSSGQLIPLNWFQYQQNNGDNQQFIANWWRQIPYHEGKCWFFGIPCRWRSSSKEHGSRCNSICYILWYVRNGGQIKRRKILDEILLNFVNTNLTLYIEWVFMIILNEVGDCILNSKQSVLMGLFILERI